MKIYSLKRLMLGLLIANTASATTLTWHATRAAAVAEAQATGKQRIFLLIGNASCGGCANTKYYWCESTTLYTGADGNQYSAKQLIEDHYVLWYCDEWVDEYRQEGWVYYSQMKPDVTSSLPHSWIIDVNTMNALDVAGDEQYPNMLVDRFSTWMPSEPALPTFAQWIQNYGLPAADQNHDDCPAEDGVPNLLKYACGLAPTNPCATTELMQGVVSNGTFGIVYYKSKETSDVQLNPIWISSLSNTEWTATGIITEQLADEAGREKWKASVSSPEAQGYIRLQAVQE